MDSVDDLLARYLGLLHEYARLRALLAADTAALFGHLARANFAAERGLRYGPAHFDGRMQATARLVVGAGEGEGVPSFAIRRGAEGDEKEDDDKKEEENKDGDGNDEKDEKDQKDDHTDKKDTGKNKKPQNTDPLRWFGVLTPPALRQAQQAAVHAVDAVVPQLAAVSAEMAAVELAVRRARKRRAKAAAAADKAEAKAAKEQGALAQTTKETRDTARPGTELLG